MTTTNDKTECKTLVDIDISKSRNDILIQRPGRKRYRMQITNDRADHDRFIQHVMEITADIIKLTFFSARRRSPSAYKLSAE